MAVLWQYIVKLTVKRSYSVYVLEVILTARNGQIHTLMHPLGFDF